MSLRPWYNQDANYQTNAKSFMDYLGRTNKFLEVLIEDYEIFQELVIEELERIKFDSEMAVSDILVNWLDDGTLERIINETLFNQKLDKATFEAYKNEVDNLLNTLQTDVANQLKNQNDEVNDLLNNQKDEVNDLLSSIPKNHYASESFSNLQSAVYGAENGVLHVKKGTYLIDTPIKIKSNTTIIANGSIFRRNGNINNMFINDSNGTKGGYNANENITIIGGVFDASAGSFSDNCSPLVFGHSKNIKILDNTFRNLENWHMIEVNACQNVLIENNHLENYGSSTKGTEMIQIDIAKSTTEFPWFGPYDNTTCDNIVINQNTFLDGVRGVGTHSATDGKEHTRITITNNKFTNMRKEAVLGLDWAFTKINGNHFYNVYKGIVLSVRGRSVNNHSIMDNYISGKRDEDKSRGIHILGFEDGFGIHGGTIRGNKVKRFESHGIGVDFSNKWVIEGNECQDNGKSGIIIWGSSHVTVTGNISIGNNENDAEQFDLVVRKAPSKYITITGNTLAGVRVFNDVFHTFLTSNIITDRINFVDSDTRVRKNNFINGVYVE